MSKTEITYRVDKKRALEAYEKAADILERFVLPVWRKYDKDKEDQENARREQNLAELELLRQEVKKEEAKFFSSSRKIRAIESKILGALRFDNFAIQMHLNRKPTSFELELELDRARSKCFQYDLCADDLVEITEEDALIIRKVESGSFYKAYVERAEKQE